MNTNNVSDVLLDVFEQDKTLKSRHQMSVRNTLSSLVYLKNILTVSVEQRTFKFLISSTQLVLCPNEDQKTSRIMT